MDWLSALEGSAVVALDTAPLIYFIEKHPVYAPVITPFFEELDRGSFRVITSTLTLTEVLVHPFRNGKSDLADRYFQILTTSKNLAVLPVSDIIAIEAARLRASRGLRTPDAIQMATALIGGATSFLTNDAGIAPIPGLRIILLDQLIRET
jgi:predicted nucleic acid-binding protein